jgi:hypothetical protein
MGCWVGTILDRSLAISPIAEANLAAIDRIFFGRQPHFAAVGQSALPRRFSRDLRPFFSAFARLAADDLAFP